MNKISNIISMPVISLYESKHIGIIYNITLDYKQKKCKYACILNEEDNILSIVDFNDIYKIGKDCVFIKNTTVMNLKDNFDKELEVCDNPINFKIYNINGNYIGNLIDIEINNKYEITSIIIDNGQTIKKDNIVNIGNIVLISDNTVKISKFKPIIKEIPINTINFNDKVLILNNTKEKNNNKIITDFRFLVGRILSKDVVALNGEIIARHGSIVTKDVVNKASYYGKLVEIARYSTN